MNNDNGKFFSGFWLGLILGGGAVFLLGTKTGRNLVKIVSEQGLDGLVNLLEEYDLADFEQEEGDEEEAETEEPLKDEKETPQKSILAKEHSNGESRDVPKKRFFKRFKK